MRVCQSCLTVEGKTRELTESERSELGLSPDEEADEICAECDDLYGEFKNYDEDYGKER